VVDLSRVRRGKEKESSVKIRPEGTANPKMGVAKKLGTSLKKQGGHALPIGGGCSCMPPPYNRRCNPEPGYRQSQTRNSPEAVGRELSVSAIREERLREYGPGYATITQ